MTVLPPSAADTPPVTLRYESGKTKVTFEDGNQWITIGALVENPTDRDVYDVEFELGFIGRHGIPLETTTFTLPVLGAGDTEPLVYTGSMSSEGFEDLEFRIAHFAYTDSGVAAPSLAPVELSGLRIEPEALGVRVLGRLTNTGPAAIGEANVICVFRIDGKIVGGDYILGFYGLPPGERSDFEMFTAAVPPAIDDFDCEASALEATTSV